jgi:methylaspartate mutase epsilon subunit
MFFAQQGIESISLSYAQQTHPGQDEEAVQALHDIAADLLTTTAWHVVIYAYMGLYPTTRAGALHLLSAAARLAKRSGAARLIVKTAAEASQIPSIADNVAAMRVAAESARQVERAVRPPTRTGIETEARSIIERVLGLHDDIGRALVAAFALGFLDVPYCLHPDNGGRTRSHLADDGRLQWTATGALPIPNPATPPTSSGPTATELLRALSYVRDRYDTATFVCQEGKCTDDHADTHPCSAHAASES